jgi:hypothetical protein
MYNTRLTVADAREALNRVTKDASTFLSELNQVEERIILSKQYKGNVIKAVFESSIGYITLGPDYLNAIGAAYNHWPTPIFGEFHTYFECGPGTPLETLGWMGQLQDMGDGFPTQVDITQAVPQASPPVSAVPGSIVLYSTGSDNGKTVRLYGLQEETGLPVTDESGNPGEVVTLQAPFTTSKYHYTKLTDVVKAVTNGPVTAWVAPTGGGSEYQIATWRPGETRPRYRRYFTGRAEKAIQILARRRYQVLRAETDWVIGNVAALKFGIQAIRHENTGFGEIAKDEWASAFYWLDQESAASNEGAQTSVPAGMWGWMEPLPNTR